MLLRFGVANYRSIRDYQEILLVASGSHDQLTMPVPVVDASVIPVIGLFGANASGKSNLLDAMVDMRLLVARSHKDRDGTDRIPRFPFRLDARSAEKPTRFDCSFTLELGSNDVPVYDLEIEFTENEIRHEQLRRTVRHERRSTHTLYTRRNRNGKAYVEFGPQLQGENKVTAKLTRSNSLFLSTAAQNNHPQLTAVHKWFTSNWHSLISTEPLSGYAVADAVVANQNHERLVDLLQQAETGVCGIEISEREVSERSQESARDMAKVLVDRLDVEDRPDLQEFAEQLDDSTRKQLCLLHQSGGKPLPLDYGSESQGTKMFLTLVLPALESLSTGGVLLIDELASSLHPRLAEAFVSLFLRPESNPNGAQLVFSTHDITLLGAGLLSRDAIWLVEKDLEGVSSLIPMSDYKLRGDFERAYRNGRVGGTPDLHQFVVDLTT